ncbi:MAG TPA: hypothetical protein DCZ71_06330 [Ruminococcus sp.]|nr:hypothetical protein [Ruminococcus sp.]
MKKDTRTSRFPAAAGFIATILAALGFILYCNRVWEMDLSVPFGYGGDCTLDSMIIKSIVEYGHKGLYFCYRMGAPGISELIDTPFFDINLSAQIWVLSKFTKSYPLIFYLIYFMTYPSAAGAMYLLTGKVTERIPLRAVAGFIYAIAPYHFFRAMSHITLSNYFVVPIGIWLAMLIAEEPFKGLAPERFGKKGWWKTAVMYLSCILLGLSNIYYAFFALFCMGLALLYKCFSTGKIKGIWREAASLVVLLVSVLASLMPKILYTSQNGANEIAGIRAECSTEIYALKIIQMILPPGFTASPFLKKLIDHYNRAAFNVNENAFSSLGAVAVAGFLLMCLWVIYRLSAPGRTKDSRRAKQLDHLSLTAVALLLYCMGGGFGALISYFVTPEIRCLTRGSIVISCLCLCVFVITADHLLSISTKADKLRKGAVWTAVAGICCLSVYADTARSAPHWHDSMQQKNVVLTEFFGKVEDTMDDGDMIYQLPYMQFPEVPPIENMQDYQPAVGYLYTDTLRWSYGGMKGRSDPVLDLSQLPAGDELLNNIRDRGFAGVYIDTDGYADKGAADIAYFRDTLGIEPIVASDNTLYFFDIRNAEVK